MLALFDLNVAFRVQLRAQDSENDGRHVHRGEDGHLRSCIYRRHAGSLKSQFLDDLFYWVNSIKRSRRLFSTVAVQHGADADEKEDEREENNDPTDLRVDAAEHVQHPRPQRNVDDVEKDHHHGLGVRGRINP